MSFQDILEPQVMDRLIKLIRNDVLIRAWYQACSNPENPMPQDANALAWLVEMLAIENERLRQALFDHLCGRSGIQVMANVNDVMLQLAKEYEDVAKARRDCDRSSAGEDRPKSIVRSRRKDGS